MINPTLAPALSLFGWAESRWFQLLGWIQPFG
jgi:hypothetical protein